MRWGGLAVTVMWRPRDEALDLIGGAMAEAQPRPSPQPMPLGGPVCWPASLSFAAPPPVGGRDAGTMAAEGHGWTGEAAARGLAAASQEAVGRDRHPQAASSPPWSAEPSGACSPPPGGVARRCASPPAGRCSPWAPTRATQRSLSPQRWSFGRSAELEELTCDFWARQPAATRLLDHAVSDWMGVGGACGLQAAASNAACSPAVAEDWVRVLLWQEAEIGRLMADSAMWRTKLGAQEKVLLDASMQGTPLQHELGRLFKEVVRQRDEIGKLLDPGVSLPPNSWRQRTAQEAPDGTRCGLLSEVADATGERSQGRGQEGDCEPDPLEGLHRAFVSSGFTIRSPEALSELMRHNISDVVDGLLDGVCRLRRRRRHAAAAEAVRRAQLRDVVAQCDELLREKARLAAEDAQQQDERQRYAGSLLLRRSPSPPLRAISCGAPRAGPSPRRGRGDAAPAPRQWWAGRAEARGGPCREPRFDAYSVHHPGAAREPRGLAGGRGAPRGMRRSASAAGR